MPGVFVPGVFGPGRARGASRSLGAPSTQSVEALRTTRMFHVKHTNTCLYTPMRPELMQNWGTYAANAQC